MPCSWRFILNMSIFLPTVAALLTILATLSLAHAEELGQDPPVSGQPAPNAALVEALAQLQLPGITINVEEWSVDVTSHVVLKTGTLELIACTPDTKVHESIIAVEAKPSHIHTALLLLGAKPGTPAMMKPMDEDQTIFRPIPPSGDLVDVYLLIPGEDGGLEERPISDFLELRDDDEFAFDQPEKAGQQKKFSTHSFLFAGSHLVGEEGEQQRYLADISGHVITITTFGDELLCLPGFHEHANEALMWQVAADGLPELEAEVILRLRPQLKPPPAADSDPEEKPTPAEPEQQPTESDANDDDNGTVPGD